MAIPSSAGMRNAGITILVIPVLYCWVKEIKLYLGAGDALSAKQDAV